MEGYYILVGILTIFFIGIISIIYDMISNKEREIIIRKKIQKKEPDVSQLISNEYEYDDGLFDE